MLLQDILFSPLNLISVLVHAGIALVILLKIGLLKIFGSSGQATVRPPLSDE